MEESSNKKKLSPDEPPTAAATLLTDDLIVEILCRLPVRSVHRFKCVSMPWRDLIAHPTHRKKLPQTLAGFFYRAYPGGYRHHFASISGGAATVDLDPSLAFLQPMKYTDIELVDTCNGLLLCACSKENPSAQDEFRFVVCNPATERWAELPPHPAEACLYSTWLAFDPAVSSHFHVLSFEDDQGGCVTGVNIYSSQTGAWNHRDSGLVEETSLSHGSCASVFFGGMMYLLGKLNRHQISTDNINTVLVAVDVEGKAWKTIHVPNGVYLGIIGLSQGCLHYATTVAPVRNNDNWNAIVPWEIALWYLENHDSKEWVLKHSVNIDKLSDMDKPLIISDWELQRESEYMVVGIHPDCDTLFLVRAASSASYDMRRQNFCNILDLEEGSMWNYLPYVPLFSESLADADG